MSNIEKSRKATVEVISVMGKSKGTGFFISKSYVATCFHVVSTLAQSQNKVDYNIYTDIKIKTYSGEIISASCVSIPNQGEQTPILYDFAILKLSSEPTSSIEVLRLASGDDSLNVGAEIMFSGFPLAAPSMITHEGMISGIAINGDVFCVQAPINKGNSGGALIGTNTEVLGIISNREGGISKGLDKLKKYIEETSKHGNVKVMGVDPLQSIRALIETIDQYISTGIGYAINIKHLKKYCASRPEFLK